MEDIHTANHCWLIHEWQVVHSPRYATELGIHLDENLRHDGSQILAALDGGREDDLGGNWVLSQKESLDVIIQHALSFGAWEK